MCFKAEILNYKIKINNTIYYNIYIIFILLYIGAIIIYYKIQLRKKFKL